MEGEFTESIYNKSTETTKNYLKGIHAKLKTYGTYGKRKASPQDERAQSLAYMTEKYGERAMQDLVNRHSGE